MSKEVAENLRRAKALILDEANWTQHVFRDGSRMCARGALKAVVTGEAEIRAEEALEAALPRQARGRAKWASYVARYNDNVSTTHADILRLFDDAIAAEEAA